MDRHRLPDEPDEEAWVDDDFFGWVHKTSYWHTVTGTRLRKLRGALAFVAVAPDGAHVRPSPPAVSDDDLEPE